MAAVKQEPLKLKESQSYATISFMEFLVILLTAAQNEKPKVYKDKLFKLLKENIAPVMFRDPDSISKWVVDKKNKMADKSYL